MHILGGGERVCLHIVRALLEEKHDVTLISEPISIDELKVIVSPDLLRDLKWISYEPFRQRGRRFTVYQRVLHHWLMKNRLKNETSMCDVEILSQDIMFLGNVGKKKVAYVHYPEYLVHLEGATLRSRWFWKTYYAPLLWHWHNQIDKIDLFLCNSEYTRRAIKLRWGKEADVVYPPVDIENIKPAPKEDYVITVGRFVKVKNYETVIEVAKLLPDVKFVIVGRKQDKDYYEKIVRLKPDNVTLLSNLSQTELLSMLARAKVYLHTMIGEHFGISIVEAMAAGCIPVVHNSGGAKEAIGDFGRVYNATEECSTQIGGTLREEVDVSGIAEYARRFSAEVFRSEIKKKLKQKGVL